MHVSNDLFLRNFRAFWALGTAAAAEPCQVKVPTGGLWVLKCQIQNYRHNTDPLT